MASARAATLPTAPTRRRSARARPDRRHRHRGAARWDLKVLSDFLDSLDTPAPAPAPAATPAPVPAAAADEDSPEPIRVHDGRRHRRAPPARAKCPNAVVNEWHEDKDTEEPVPYWFRALRPAEEAFAILKTVVAANTRSIRGLGYSLSRDTPAKVVLPGKIVYGFSGSESAAAAPGPAARGAHGRADPLLPWPPPATGSTIHIGAVDIKRGALAAMWAAETVTAEPEAPTRPCPPPPSPSATQ